MTFILETDLTARRATAPGENAGRNRSAPKESGSGADFARSLAAPENETPEKDAPKLSVAASSDIPRAASALIEQQSPANLPVPTDTAAATDAALDIKSDIVIEGVLIDDAEADPVSTDVDEALPAGDPTQTVAILAATVPPPSPVEQKPSDTIAAKADMAALPGATVPQDQALPAQVDTTDETSGAPEGIAKASTGETVSDATNLMAVGVAQGGASKATGTTGSQSDKAATTASTSSKAEINPDEKVQRADKHKADVPTMEVEGADTAALSALAADQNTASKLATAHDKAGSVDPAAMAMTAGTPPAPVLQSAAPITPPVMTPTNALVVATPAEVVDILSDSLASPDEKKNHVHIQLDPPELGRVSLDFKFDTHGLQHVTIVGETPEAMRQLRLMHFELVNALERQGLSSENMSYQQQQTPQDSGQQTGRDANTPQRNVSGQTARALPELVLQNTIQSRPTSIAGLNIKL